MVGFDDKIRNLFRIVRLDLITYFYKYIHWVDFRNETLRALLEMISNIIIIIAINCLNCCLCCVFVNTIKSCVILLI
jgi:hypothetical protein